MNAVNVGDVWRKRGPCDWLKVVREVMTGKQLGRLQVVEVTYSQPVTWQ